MPKLSLHENRRCQSCHKAHPVAAADAVAAAAFAGPSCATPQPVAIAYLRLCWVGKSETSTMDRSTQPNSRAVAGISPSKRDQKTHAALDMEDGSCSCVVGTAVQDRLLTLAGDCGSNCILHTSCTTAAYVEVGQGRRQETVRAQTGLSPASTSLGHAFVETKNVENSGGQSAGHALSCSSALLPSALLPSALRPDRDIDVMHNVQLWTQTVSALLGCRVAIGVSFEWAWVWQHLSYYPPNC